MCSSPSCDCKPIGCMTSNRSVSAELPSSRGHIDMGSRPPISLARCTEHSKATGSMRLKNDQLAWSTHENCAFLSAQRSVGPDLSPLQIAEGFFWEPQTRLWEACASTSLAFQRD